MAGCNLYWAQAESELRELAEALGIPVFLNGLGPWLLPARPRALLLARPRLCAQGCDVALVIGVPLDFRLGFGGSIADDAKLIQLDFAPSRLDQDAPAGSRSSRRHRRHAHRDPRVGAGRSEADLDLDQPAPEDRGREARGGAGSPGRRPLADAPDAHLQGARRLPRPRRDRGRRRRRLRQLRRARLGDLGARHLDGPRPLRLPRRRSPDRRSARSSPTPSARSACCSATAPSASPGWSSTRWSATTCRSSR